eukprot:scaffold303880_cov39-Prasinocladus_malaysianus.AAC.1
MKTVRHDARRQRRVRFTRGNHSGTAWQLCPLWSLAAHTLDACPVAQKVKTSELHNFNRPPWLLADDDGANMYHPCRKCGLAEVAERRLVVD